jgi:hypothetical protein
MVDVSKNTYHEWWIGKGGPIARPPFSPDLNPLDRYMRRQLNDNEEALHSRTVDARQAIRVPRGALNMMEEILITFIKVLFQL